MVLKNPRDNVVIDAASLFESNVPLEWFERIALGCLP